MLSILNLLVISSLWISFVAGCCPLLVGVVYGIPVEPWKVVVAFLCAFFVYSMDKISGSMEDLLNTPGRAILANYPIKQFAMVAYLAAFIITIVSEPAKWYCVAVFGLAGWLYTQQIHGLSMVYPWFIHGASLLIPNIKMDHGLAKSTMALRLKDVPGLKAPYVAATCTICFAGLAGAGYSLIFLLILINTIIFDIRDVIGDAAAGVRTIPVLIGVSRTAWILAILDLPLLYLDPITGLIGAGLIFYFRHQMPSLQYDYLVDGWVVVSLVLNYLAGLGRLI